MQYSKWLTRLGGYGYDLLILINHIMNKILLLLKKERYSFSKKVKGRIKLAVKFINQFEKTIKKHKLKYSIIGNLVNSKKINKKVSYIGKLNFND